VSANNINVVKKVFEEIFAKGDLSMYNELIDQNIQAHCPASWMKIHPNEVSGISSSKEIDKAYSNAFKINYVEMQDIIANDDKVVVRWSCNGMHVGDFFGIPATHKKILLTGVSIFRLAHGKVAEVWQSWDMFGLLQQIKG
jgi:steroid delta-isomerase-like uncharacterized protein